VEQRLNRKFNLNIDLGIVLNYKSSDTENFSLKKGFRAVVEPRYYLRSTQARVPFYLAPVLYYHRITYNREETLGRDCQEGFDCAYFQEVTYRVKYNQLGAGFKVGILLYPPLTPKRSLFFDLSGGISYKHSAYEDINKPNPPNSVYFPESRAWFVRPVERRPNAVVPIIAIRVGYKIQ
jgi:hypothetical protein